MLGLNTRYCHQSYIVAEPLVWCTTGSLSDEQHHMLNLVSSFTDVSAPPGLYVSPFFYLSLFYTPPLHLEFSQNPQVLKSSTNTKSVLRRIPSATWVNAPALNAPAALAVRAALAASTSKLHSLSLHASMYYPLNSMIHESKIREGKDT